jgi:hypothetical protein
MHIKRTHTRLLPLALSIAMLLTAAARADFIDFEADTDGAKPEGFQSVQSSRVSFRNPTGFGLQMFSGVPELIGRGLLALGDSDAGALQMDFTVPMTSLSLVFGNDQAGYLDPGDLARLKLFNGPTLVGTVDVVCNLNDLPDQTVSYSGAPFTRAIFQYVNPDGTPEGLIEAVENISFGSTQTTYTLANVAVVGDAVPDAEPGEVFTKFYTPAHNNFGTLGLHAQTVDTAGVKRESFFALAPDLLSGTRLLLKGQTLATLGGTPLKSFKTPAFNAQQSIGLLGKLGGTTLPENDTAILFQPGGSTDPLVVAQEGQPANGTLGRWKSFKALALGNGSALSEALAAPNGGGPPVADAGTLFYTGGLIEEGAISKANDRGLWAYSSYVGTSTAVLVEGASYDIDGTPRTLASFKTLGAPAPGGAQGHSVVHDSCLALAKFTDKATALVVASPHAALSTLAVSGDPVTDQPPATTIKSFGVPTNFGDGAIALAKLSDKTVRIGAFFHGFDFAMLDSRHPVGGHPDARVKGLKDPVARDPNNFAVLAKLTGTDASAAPITSANDDAILGSFHEPMLAVAGNRAPRRGTNGFIATTPPILAREGQIAPGTTAATFSKFKSLLVPQGDDAGVVFLAQLTLGVDGVTSANNDGIWAYTNAGGLHKVVREGDVIDLGDGDETVKKIIAFKAVGGSPDHQRSGRTHDRPQVLVLLQLEEVVPPGSEARTRYRAVSLEK